MSDYLPRFAACRDVGHAWDYAEWYGSRRTLICSNCDARRDDKLDNFEIASRKYKYPAGYSLKNTPISIKVLRRQLSREASKLARWVGVKTLTGK